MKMEGGCGAAGGNSFRNLIRLIPINNLKHILSIPPYYVGGLERYVNSSNRSVIGAVRNGGGYCE